MEPETIKTGPTIEHKSYLGASDIGAVAGVNPFRTALDVWAAKKQDIKISSNIAMEIGNAFERPSLDIYSKLKNAKLNYPGTLLHPKFQWAGATPDAIANDRLVVEVKIVGWPSAKFWGDPDDGPEGIPDAINCQVHWQSWIVAACFGHLCEVADVVCVQGTKMAIYEVPIERTMIDHLHSIGHEFWRVNVLEGQMPELEGKHVKDILEAIHPKHLKDQLEPMPPSVSELAARYQNIRKEIREAEENKSDLYNQMINLIGDKAGFENKTASSGEASRITWKAQKGRPAWKTIAEDAGSRIDRNMYQHIIKKGTPESSGRVLRVNIKK